MTTKRTDIELIGPSVATATDPVERHELPGLKRIRINGIEVNANKITIDGDSERDGRLVAVTARLWPSSLRFITAAEADNTEPVLVVEQVSAALTEALNLANARVKELERQLDAHHRHDAELTTADDVRAAAAARIRSAADEFAENVEADPGSWNTGEASAYYTGMSAAASIAADETPEADPNVAHIDTVNGRDATLGIMENIKEHEGRNRSDRDDEAIDG